MANQLPGEKPTPRVPSVDRPISPPIRSRGREPKRPRTWERQPFTTFRSCLTTLSPAGSRHPRDPVFSVIRRSWITKACAGWRLVLDPGQTAAPFKRTAPGLRIVLDGAEIAEIVAGQPDRGMNLRLGEYYWQEPGMTCAIRNVGSTRVELLQFGLK